MEMMVQKQRHEEGEEERGGLCAREIKELDFFSAACAGAGRRDDDDVLRADGISSSHAGFMVSVSRRRRRQDLANSLLDDTSMLAYICFMNYGI